MIVALVLMASYPVVVAGIGTLAVAIAAVVVVLAIIAVIVMVMRSGGGRQASGGIGYDARQRPMGQSRNDQSRNDYDGPPSPWAHQSNRGTPAAMGQDGGMNYGGQARTSGANWNAEPAQQHMAGPGAWGAPAGGQYGQGAQPAAQANGAWGDGNRGWNGAGGGSPMGGQAAGQNGAAAPWGDGSAGPAGARPWDAPAAQGWAPPQSGSGMPSNGAWGQPDPQPMSSAPWGGAPAAVEQPAAPNWGQPPAAAPAQNAWGVPSGAAAPNQNAWGVPSTAGAQSPEAWGTPAVPTSPNWNPAAGQASAPAWGQPAPDAGSGYDAAPPNAPYGSDMDPRQRVASSMRPGVVVVKQGKEPGRVFEIRGDRLTIGRSRDSDIFLEDLAVSRLHATVYREANGQYIVRDENSANGTTVNGQRITDHVLEEGDEIGLGTTTLTFVRR